MDTLKKEKRNLHPYIIIFVILLLAVLMTWVVPAGEFDRVLDEDTGREMIVSDSFHTVEKTPVGLADFFMCIQQGFVSGSTLIAFILVIGGSFGILTATGAVDAMIAKMVGKFRGKSYEMGIFVIIYTFLFLIGSLFGMGGPDVLAFIPFFVIMCVSLGYDAIVAISLMIVALCMSNCGSITNPFNITIAQQIAELPIFSGTWFRVINAALVLVISLIYLLHYARKVKKDPAKSLVADLDFSHVAVMEDPDKVVLTAKHKRVLAAFFLFFVFMLWGSMKYAFSMAQLTAVFMGLGIIIAIAGWVNINDACDQFVQGAKDMVFGAIMVGFAMGIQEILNQGNILDTIVNAMIQPLSAVPTVFVPSAMIFVQAVINLLIPSSTAMAVVSMPILVPIADALDIQRQTVILSFQYGDGVTNLIQPNWETLVMVLALSKVPLQRFVKFTLPLVVIMLILGCIMTTVMHIIQVGPF